MKDRNYTCRWAVGKLGVSAWSSLIHGGSTGYSTWLAVELCQHRPDLFSVTGAPNESEHTLPWWRCMSDPVKQVEHIFVHLLAVCISSLAKCLFKSFAHFKSSHLSFYPSRLEFLYILDTSPYQGNIIYKPFCVL